MVRKKGGDTMNIGNRIKARRTELKMSADHLAKLIGKDRSTVYRYESGSINKLSADMLEPLADALQTTPAYLIGLDRAEESEIASFMSSEGMQLRHMEEWNREMGHITFTDEENREIINFAKYLVIRRGL
jgi:transcriptional regulator with XRE-family HTH domain